jgi:uncharacterized membrane protein
MKNSSFIMRWGYFAIGLVIGIFSLVIMLFLHEDRRDKFYSLLTGALISMLLNILLFYYIRTH